MNETAAHRNQRCSVARSLEVVGEKWSLLIVREALRGYSKFADFRSRLGIAPDILAARLATLVDNGVLERRPYQLEGQRPRDEYVLTAAGLELKLVLAALTEWGDVNRPSGYGPASQYVDRTTRRPVRLAFIADDGREAPLTEVEAVLGPGSAGTSG